MVFLTTLTSSSLPSSTPTSMSVSNSNSNSNVPTSSLTSNVALTTTLNTTFLTLPPFESPPSSPAPRPMTMDPTNLNSFDSTHPSTLSSPWIVYESPTSISIQIPTQPIFPITNNNNTNTTTSTTTTTTTNSTSTITSRPIEEHSFFLLSNHQTSLNLPPQEPTRSVEPIESPISR